MDSLTQALLGASVAEAAIGAKVGRRAAVIGAVVGTMPDLDVFVPLGDPISDFVQHRSATHSLIVATLAAPLIAWGARQLARSPPEMQRRWILAVWLVLVTHIGLDCLTIYGTQVLWPLSRYPVGLGSAFIIDPFYTLTLAFGLFVLALARRDPARGHRVNSMTLTATTLYLVAAVAIQAHVRAFAERDLNAQGVRWNHLAVLAAPFNVLSWRIVAVGDAGYHVAWHSVIAPAPALRLERYPSDPSVLGSLARHEHVRKLRAFSKGFNAVEEVDGEIVIRDLRMGVEPDRYAFTFVVGERADDGVRAVPVRHVRPERLRDGDLGRIFDVVLGAPNLKPR